MEDKVSASEGPIAIMGTGDSKNGGCGRDEEEREDQEERNASTRGLGAAEAVLGPLDYGDGQYTGRMMSRTMMARVTHLSRMRGIVRNRMAAASRSSFGRLWLGVIRLFSFDHEKRLHVKRARTRRTRASLLMSLLRKVTFIVPNTNYLVAVSGNGPPFYTHCLAATHGPLEQSPARLPLAGLQL